jgi:hypothetical protein
VEHEEPDKKDRYCTASDRVWDEFHVRCDRSSEPRHVSDKHVTSAPYGLDNAFGILAAHLSTEPTDLDINTTIEARDGGAIARHVEQLFARQYALRRLEECKEKIVLARTHVDDDTISIGELAAKGVDGPTIEFVGGAGRRLDEVGRLVDPPQQRADSR